MGKFVFEMVNAKGFSYVIVSLKIQDGVDLKKRF